MEAGGEPTVTHTQIGAFGVETHTMRGAELSLLHTLIHIWEVTGQSSREWSLTSLCSITEASGSFTAARMLEPHQFKEELQPQNTQTIATT